MQRTAVAAAKTAAKAKHGRGSRYLLLRPLGAGGMGVVYEADDTRLGRRVALKFSSAKGARSASAVRLRQEAAALASVDHPHICKVYDVDEHDGWPCIVMERLEGMDLKRHLAAGRLEMAEIIAIALQIGDALETAHRAGLIHQDVKPANIFITASGPVKLLDFGLAVTLTGAAAAAVAGAPRPELLGTTSYIAPERILNLPITPCSDLFSLGAVIYEMATGQRPFTGSTPAETIFNLLDQQPRPLTGSAPHLPIALNDIVMKLLEKQPARRYQSAADLRRALLRIGSRRRTPHLYKTTTLLKGEHHASINQ